MCHFWHILMPKGPGWDFRHEVAGEGPKRVKNCRFLDPFLTIFGRSVWLMPLRAVFLAGPEKEVKNGCLKNTFF